MRAPIFVLAAAVAGVLIGSTVAFESRPSSGESTRRQEAKIAPDEVVFVLIGGEFCAAHCRPGFIEAVEKARTALKQTVKQRGWGFSATGVALDWSIKDGLQFLARFDEWDEVIAGRNWFGFGAITFVWRDFPGEAAVPQVLVLHRRAQPLLESVEVERDQEIARLLGIDEIIAWAEAGAPVQIPQKANAQ